MATFRLFLVFILSSQRITMRRKGNGQNTATAIKIFLGTVNTKMNSDYRKLVITINAEIYIAIDLGYILILVLLIYIIILRKLRFSPTQLIGTLLIIQ